MAKYIHIRAEVDVEPFVPAPEPGPGEQRKPEMEGVERVVVMDGAGAPRAVVYECGQGKLRAGLRPGDMITKDANGVFIAYAPAAFAREYVLASNPEASTEEPQGPIQ